MRLFIVILILVIGLLGHTANAEIPSTEQVKSDLEGKYAAKAAQPRLDRRGPLAHRLEKLMLQQGRYLISTLHRWEKDPSALSLTRSGSNEHNIRPNTHTAFGLAVIYRCIKDGYPPGVSPELCRDKAIAILRFVLSTHGASGKTCSNGKQWRNQWQSAYWASSAGKAAWLLWDELDPQMRWLAAKMICDEADRFVGKTPPTRIELDTKAEENAWNSEVIALAYSMFPHHPKHQAYQETAIRWAISSCAREADVANEQIYDGRPLRGWLTGGNVHEDYTLENHSRVHPDYMSAWVLCSEQIPVYEWGGNQPPQATVFNADRIYANSKTFCFPDGSHIYPNGQDWGLHRNPDWLRMHSAQAILFGDRRAAALFRNTLDTAERMAARNPNGGIYHRNERHFPSAQHSILESMSSAYLMLASRGEGARHLSQERLWQDLSGRYIYNAGKFGILRSSRTIAAFAWGRRIMGMVMPLQDDLLLTPYERGLIGTLNVQGVKKEKPVLEKVNVADFPDKLGVCGVLARANGLVTQRFGFLALPDGRALYVDTVQPKPEATIKSLALGTLGVLNESTWVYHNGQRTLYHSQGKTIFTALGDKEPAHDFQSQWYNIDDELGIVCLKTSGHQRYVPNHKPHRGRLQQLFHLNYLEDVDNSLVESVIVFYPAQKKDSTRIAAGQCRLQTPASNRYLVQLEDGMKVEFDLDNLVITVAMK